MAISRGLWDSQRLIIQVSDTGSCEPLVKDCDTLDNFFIYYTYALTLTVFILLKQKYDAKSGNSVFKEK